MDSLSDLQSKFNNIISLSGVDGTVLDISANLLSRAVYENQLMWLNYSVESHPSTCKFLSSAIVHAIDVGYSVGRGSNQRIRVRNVLPVANMSVRKFDLALEVDGMKLVYAQDYDFTTNTKYQDNTYIELILCARVCSGSTTISDTTRFKFDVLDADISQDFALYDNDYVEYKHVFDSISELVSDPMEDVEKFFFCTLPGYGVRVCCPDTMVVGSKLRYKYLEYTTDTISTSSITSLPDFTPIDDYEIEFEVVNPVNREEDPDSIYFNSNRYFLSGRVMKSDYDVVELIQSYFEEYFSGSNIYINIANGGSYGDEISVFFIPTTSNTTTIKERIDQFYTEVVQAYYITQNIIFYDISSTATNEANTIVYTKDGIDTMQRSNYKSYTLDLTVYYENSLPNAAVSQLVKDYTNKIGGEYSFYKFLAEFSELENVKYVEASTTLVWGGESEKGDAWDVANPLRLYGNNNPETDVDNAATCKRLMFSSEEDRTDILSGVNITYELYKSS